MSVNYSLCSLDFFLPLLPAPWWFCPPFSWLPKTSYRGSEVHISKPNIGLLKCEYPVIFQTSSYIQIVYGMRSILNHVTRPAYRSRLIWLIRNRRALQTYLLVKQTSKYWLMVSISRCIMTLQSDIYQSTRVILKWIFLILDKSKFQVD